MSIKEKMRDSSLAHSCAPLPNTLAHLSEVTGHRKCDFFLSEFMFDRKTNLVYQFLYNITLVTFMLIAGNVNQRMEKLEISQQSTESRTVLVEERVDHLQGDSRNDIRSNSL